MAEQEPGEGLTKHLPEPANALELPVGSTVGRYVVLGRLGEGGMGVVYAGHDPELDRRVALKLLLAEGAGAGTPSAGSQARLLREAQALARLAHPNVVAIHDVGTFNGRVFIAMELVEGVNLKGWLSEKRKPWREVVRVFAQAGKGLVAAHEKGLVHRDFKPANVLLGSDGRARVLDFGLARSGPMEATQQAIPPNGTDESGSSSSGSGRATPLLNSPLTQVGVLTGTPGYLPPEAWEGQPPNALSDQFSFAVSLYEALYGERPFSTRRPAEQRWQLPQPPKEVRLPSWLRAAVLKGLSLKPDGRFASMEAFVDALEKGPARMRQRRVLAGLALGTTLLVATTVVLQRRTASLCRDTQVRLTGVWDSRRESALKKAFLDTQSPRAEEAFSQLRVGLNAYASAWADMAREACEATRIRGEQSDEALTLRMACLDQRLGEVKALVDVLSDGSQNPQLLLNESVKAAQALSPLSPCADVTALRLPVPPPKDTATRARIADLEPKVARGKALLDSGQYKEGLVLMERVAPEVASVGYRPLEARALDTLGYLQEKVGDFKGAEGTFLAAVDAAIAGGDGHMAAFASARLVREGYLETKPDLSLGWAQHTRAFLERIGGEPLAEAYLEMALGALELLKVPKQALPHFQRALNLRTRAVGPDNPLVAAAWGNIGMAYRDMGEFQQSLEANKMALSIDTRALGPTHPATASALGQTTLTLLALDRLDEAQEMAERAKEILEKVEGPEAVSLGDPLNNLALIRLGKGLGDCGLSAVDQSLRIFNRTYGPKSSVTLFTHWVRGEVLLELERYPESIEESRRVIGSGVTPYELRALTTAGVALGMMGRESDSTAYLAKVKAFLDTHTDQEELPMRYFLALMKIHLHQGQASLAAQECPRALQAGEAFLGRSNPLLLEVLVPCAQAFARLKENDQAIQHLERALSIGEGAPAWPGRVAKVRFELAKLLAEEDKRTAKRASALLQQAKAGLTQVGDTKTGEKLTRWLEGHRGFEVHP